MRTDQKSPDLPDVRDDATGALGPMFGPMLSMMRQAQTAFANATIANIRKTTDAATRSETSPRQALSFPKLTSGESTKAVETVAKRHMQAMEAVAALATKRASAYADLPNQLAQCKGPQDLISAQMRFWQTAASDCAESSRQVMAAWGVQQDQSQGQPQDRKRQDANDLIEFKEPGDGKPNGRNGPRHAA